jgi:hypothetical protein
MNPARPELPSKRLLLLFPAQSYRVDAYVEAARRLGVGLVLGTDLPGPFARYDLPLVTVDFRHPESGATSIETAARATPLDGIVPTNESSAVVAALAAERLGLPHAASSAAYAARNRRVACVRSSPGGRAEPARSPSPNDDRRISCAVVFPCVVKPTMLTGSQRGHRADGKPGPWRRK